ncbi:MAG TPA: GWxTD domain-containing protein [Bacteroidia bacterium]|nr:GWxTD domain-containing protein [Bacteroidia bacterium]
MRLHLLVFPLLLNLCLSSCRLSGSYKGSAGGLAADGKEAIEMSEVIYHLNDSLTQLFLEIRNENLLYKYSDTSLSPYAHLKVSYTLCTGSDKKKCLDSAMLILRDKAGEELLKERFVYAGFNIRAPYGGNYALLVAVQDLNKRTTYETELEIQKRERSGRQNFLVLHKGKVAFRNSFCAGDSLKILLNSAKVSSLQVDCYFKDLAIAPPPFSTKGPPDTNLRPDSVFVLQCDGGMLQIRMPARGFYHIRNSKESAEGLSLHSYLPAFPNISNNDEMILCTRYIMSKEEFNECREAENTKKAIDKFWLELGGSNERSRELLKRYYARVRDANKYYSALAEGWKSDRGMIYIVFGEPNAVIDKGDELDWIYGSPVNQSTTTFEFKKVNSPFSDNIYVLERSAFYRSTWSTAVDMWRQGIVYEGRQ